MGDLSSLGGAILPAVATVTGMGPVVGSLASWALDGYEGNKRLDQQEKNQRLSMAQDKANASQRMAELNAQSQEAEKERLKNLKQAVAKQRASFGASGVTVSSNGSTNAVLEGFLKESEEEKSYTDKMNKLKEQAISDSLNQQTKKSLLELSQIEERQGVSKYLDIF